MRTTILTALPVVAVGGQRLAVGRRREMQSNLQIAQAFGQGGDPSDLEGLRPGRGEYAGELRLMGAVLERLIQDMMSTADSDPARYLKSQAWAWVNSHDVEWPFCFNAICGQLDLDPEYLRKKLNQMHDGKIGFRRAIHAGTGALTQPVPMESQRRRKRAAQ